MYQGPGFWAPPPTWYGLILQLFPRSWPAGWPPIPQGMGPIPSSLSICGAACSSYGAAKAAAKQPGAPTAKIANMQSDLQIPCFAQHQPTIKSTFPLNSLTTNAKWTRNKSTY